MSTTSQPPKPKRRCYRFSLLTLLIGMTVCVAVGWIGYRVQRAWVNRDRVATELKEENVTRLRMTTHPVEFDMYYSL